MFRSVAFRLIAAVSLACVLTATTASAAVISSGETRAGALNVANGYRESWTFTGMAGDRVVVSTATYTGPTQPQIELFRPDGPLIGSSTGPTSPFRLDQQLPVDGTYTITVSDYGANSDGSYTVSFANLSVPPTPGTDPDGGTIASGQSMSGTIYGYSDLDVFQFEGSVDDRIVITIGGAEPQPELYLFPPGGAPLEASHQGNLRTRRMEWRLAATGTYTILVNDFDLNTDGSYTLALAKIPGAASSPGDPDGGAIASGETRYGTLSPVIDTDLFQFVGEAGDRVVITTANLSGGSQPDFYLYPPAGAPLEASSLAGLSGHLLEWELAQSGTYTILVGDNGLNGEGTYSLSLAKVPGTATSASDPDGGALVSGETKYGYLSNRSDTDIFQFVGAAGDIVIITAAMNGTGIQPVVRAYPPSGPVEAAALDGLGSQWLQFTLLQSGTYTVVVSDYNLDGSGAYNLALAKLPGAVTSTSDPDGGTIVSGGTKLGALGYADTDLFLFSGTAGETVVFSASTLAGGIQPELRLFSPSGVLEQSSLPTTRSTRESWVLAETGVYTVLVSDGGLNSSGTYYLSLAQLPGGIAPADDENDNDGGLMLHAETKVGAFHYPADQDIYHLYGRPGDRITITAAPYGSTVQPEIYLYPPGGGVPEKTATGALTTKKLTHSLLKKGLYTVVVSDYDLNAAGNYTVLLSTSAAAPTPGIYGTFPPQGTTTVATETRFRWHAVAGATGYDVYYGTDALAPLELLATVATPSLLFPERLAGKPYSWRVVAQTPAGPVEGPFTWFKFMKSPAIHRDDFTDGNDAGDPDWLPFRYASWHVSAAKQLYSTINIDNRIISRDFSSFLTGAIQTKVMLTGSASAANASLLFSYQGDNQRYRYVKLMPGKILIGQAGLLGGQAGGVKKTIPVPTVAKKWYTLRADLDSIGNVKVYLDGKLKGTFRFKKAIAGWMGFGADRVVSYFDNFYCQEATVFP